MNRQGTTRIMRKPFLPTARQINWLLIVGFGCVGYALYLRYFAIEQSSVGLACQAGLKTWLCSTRTVMAALFTNGLFGGVALAAAALNLLRPSMVLFTIALAAGSFGIVLYNVSMSSLAAAMLVLSLARPAPETE